MKEDTYKCANCNGLFEKGWTDEECIEESRQNGFLSLPQEKLCLVCDDCYKKLMGINETKQ